MSKLKSLLSWIFEVNLNANMVNVNKKNYTIIAVIKKLFEP